MWRSCKLKPSALLGVILVVSGLWAAPLSATQIIDKGAVSFPEQEITEAGVFNLRGKGILKWGLWFEIYAAAYYVDESNPKNQKLIIKYLVPVKSEQIKSVAENHLIKQNGAEVFAELRSSLERLHAAMVDMDKGDSYAITLRNDQEFTLEHNGVEILRLTEPVLGRIYLNLWLGENPLNDPLRVSLLGMQADS